MKGEEIEEEGRGSKRRRVKEERGGNWKSREEERKGKRKRGGERRQGREGKRKGEEKVILQACSVKTLSLRAQHLNTIKHLGDRKAVK